MFCSFKRLVFTGIDFVIVFTRQIVAERSGLQSHEHHLQELNQPKGDHDNATYSDHITVMTTTAKAVGMGAAAADATLFDSPSNASQLYEHTINVSTSNIRALTVN